MLAAGNRPGFLFVPLSLSLLLFGLFSGDKTRKMRTRSIPSQLEHLHAHPGFACSEDGSLTLGRERQACAQADNTHTQTKRKEVSCRIR